MKNLGGHFKEFTFYPHRQIGEFCLFVLLKSKPSNTSKKRTVVLKHHSCCNVEVREKEEIRGGNTARGVLG